MMLSLVALSFYIMRPTSEEIDKARQDWNDLMTGNVRDNSDQTSEQSDAG